MRNTIALCAKKGQKSPHCRTICKIVLSNDEPPEWLELIPAGDYLETLDGREYSNANPEGIVKLFNEDPRDVVVDYEHASEKKAPFGDEAPASGWIDQLEVRDGAVWAHLKWTKRGHHMLSEKEYRYISPAFDYSTESLVIKRLVSAGLTNQPAFHLQVMAARDQQNMDHTGHDRPDKLEDTMLKELLALLGLSENATEDEAKAAIGKIKADGVEGASKIEGLETKVTELEGEVATARSDLKTAQEKVQPITLDKFVPRGDYDIAVARADKAEAELAEQSKTEHQDKVDTAIAAAMKAGKIAPASEEYHRANCSTAEGLAGFEAYVDKAAVIVPKSDLDDKKPETGDGAKNGELTKEQLAIARACNISAEDFKKQRAKLTATK
jgi:phage I-like protein